MPKSFLVIKTYQGDYLHKLYDTLPEANAAVNFSAEFPGDYVCAYNLETEKYIHIENFPGGINNAINDIIQQSKLDYQNAQL